LAREGIEELNDKYGNETGGPFFLFHRPADGIPGADLDGHERKRGKLAELNLLLRGGAPDRFSAVVAGRRICRTSDS